MLRLTRTAIGLLTRQYRSVLKKCWAINVGVFALGAVATTILPSDAEADLGIAVEGELDGYAETRIYQYYYKKYTRRNARSTYMDVQISQTDGRTNGPYFDLEIFLTDLSAGRLFVSGAITTHDIKTGAVTDDKIASGITASKITQNASYRFVSDTDKATWNGKQAALSSTQLAAANSGITAAKVSTYDGYSTTIAGKADSATTLLGYGITDAYTKTEVDNLISQAGGSSVYLSNYYTKSETYSRTEINNIQSLNNYYRKNKKSGILNGFEEGEKDDI